MSKRKNETEAPAEPQVSEEALPDRIKVNVKSPDDPDAGYKYEVSGDQCCEYLSQMFAVRGRLTPRMHNLIGTIRNELALSYTVG